MSKIADVLKRIDIINSMDKVYHIQDYTINDDFSVVVNENFTYAHRVGRQLPGVLDIANVKGACYIIDCDIMTLENFPHSVDGDIMIESCYCLKNINDICPASSERQRLFMDYCVVDDIMVDILGQKGYRKLFLMIERGLMKERCEEYNIVRKDNVFVKVGVRCYE